MSEVTADDIIAGMAAIHDQWPHMEDETKMAVASNVTPILLVGLKAVRWDQVNAILEKTLGFKDPVVTELNELFGKVHGDIEALVARHGEALEEWARLNDG